MVPASDEELTKLQLRENVDYQNFDGASRRVLKCSRSQLFNMKTVLEPIRNSLIHSMRTQNLIILRDLQHWLKFLVSCKISD